MYSPPYNRPEDRAEILAFMRANDFPLLITGTGGTLHASHLPVVVQERGEDVFLDMHMAKSNPQWREFFDDEVLVVFSGPHSYVSPRWYEQKERVPTWNYAAVHAYGRLEAVQDPRWLLEHVSQLTRQQETAYELPWATSDAPESYLAAMARGIVGLTLSITRLEAKSKMSQNREPRDRAGVVEGLAQRGKGEDAEVAGLVDKLNQ
jgi:transcriptional regulator